MTSSAPLPAFEDLLRHEDFVRQTLRGLLRDESRVDDAVQETWLRALQRPGAGAVAQHAEPKLWLARVARNLVFSGRRTERRRQRRERAVDRDPTAESAETSQRRVEMRQRVVSAILTLDEPYRSVVLLRYEQQLDVAAIAQRLGRSPATVRSQLSRAHEHLRRRLDRDFGGRERWAALAAPLLSPETAAAPAPAGLLLAAAGSLAAIAVVFVGWRSFVDATPAVARTGLPAAAADPEPTRGTTAADPDPALASAVPLQRVGALPQDPEPRAPQMLVLPAVELRDQKHYADYEAATFSFEHGLRDDPDVSLTRNDWDLRFNGGSFDVVTVTDDHSVIVDLGPLRPRDLGRWNAPALAFAESAPVTAGHTYFVATRDDDTDLASFVFVREHEVGDTCRFDWYTTDGSDRAQGSLTDPVVGRPWIEVLRELRAQLLRERLLSEPMVHLQLRGGAIGGNPRRINLAGEANAYVDERLAQSFDATLPVADTREPGVAFAEAGFIPPGKDFVVTRVDYSGGNPGDSNGPGGFRVVLDGKAMVDIPPSPNPIAGTWLGRVTLSPGSELRSWFEICNSSWGEVRIRGEFVDSTAGQAFGGQNRGFFAVQRPAPVAAPWALGVPRARLQVHTAKVGGNPSRIDLRGRKSMHVDRIADEPLTFTEPLPQQEQSVAFCEGGTVLPGMAFVVTKVTWSGSARGDANGHGGFRLVVAGEQLVDLDTTAEPIAGGWTGELRIVPGEESRTYLELANSSHGDVWLTGYFERR